MRDFNSSKSCTLIIFHSQRSGWANKSHIIQGYQNSKSKYHAPRKNFSSQSLPNITLSVHISSIQFADQTNQSIKHQLKSELNFIRLPKRLIVCKTTKWVYWKYNIEHLFNKYILSDSTSIHFCPTLSTIQRPGVRRSPVR